MRFGDERATKAVLSFLRGAKVGWTVTMAPRPPEEGEVGGGNEAMGEDEEMEKGEGTEEDGRWRRMRRWRRRDWRDRPPLSE